MNTTTTNLLYCCLLAMVFLLSGCDGEDEPIPAFVEILPFEVTSDYASEGSASAKITDAWLWVGTEFRGAYELPATVPILSTGNQLVTVFPGIKVNGFASRPEINNFYERYETTLDLPAGEITTVQPTTTYKDVTEFAYIENFDGPHGLDEDEDGNPNTAITTNSSEAFEIASGVIRLDVDNNVFEASTGIRFDDIPTNFSTVYLELDYKNDVQVAIGLIGHQQGLPEAKQFIFVLNTRPDWNKIYIDLTDELAASRLSEYQIVISAVLPEDRSGNIVQDEGNVYLDNLKLVHFQQ